MNSLTFLKNKKIGFTKLTLLSIALPICIIITFIGLLQIYYGEQKERTYFRQRGDAILSEYANQLFAPLMFYDYSSVIYEVRNSPKANNIRSISVYDTSGNEIVRWSDDGHKGSTAYKPLYLKKNIVVDRKKYGTVAIKFNKDELEKAVGGYRIKAFGILTSIILLISFLSFFISKMISRPINNISKQISKFDINEDELKGATINREADILMKSFDGLIKKNRDYQKLLERNARLTTIGQTASQIAHDIRKPLSSMKAMLSILPDKKNNDDFIQEFTSSIESSIRRTNSMLSEILEFSATAVSIEPRENDPQSIFTAALDRPFIWALIWR